MVTVLLPCCLVWPSISLNVERKMSFPYCLPDSLFETCRLSIIGMELTLFIWLYGMTLQNFWNQGNSCFDWLKNWPIHVVLQRILTMLLTFHRMQTIADVESGKKSIFMYSTCLICTICLSLSRKTEFS